MTFLQLFVGLVAVAVAVQSYPRYVAIPLEDLERYGIMAGSNVQEQPAIVRRALPVEEYEEAESAPAITYEERPRRQSGYGHQGGDDDKVDYGAYTGGHGAFGWYSDHPVVGRR